MHIKFTCKNCGLEKDANIRLKGTQQYCSDKKCQRVRKAAWQKQKMATDTQYRAKEIALLVSWRKQRPLDQYQKAYRQAHSEYVEKNRKRQKIRNAKRRKQAESAPNEKIVKMDAFA
ncbi:MAG: hypothetical protein ONB44_00990, partial [candidate division KSB1 bacterium]|nr:hypothetical protein [candidate division KSB1 bacterium]